MKPRHVIIMFLISIALIQNSCVSHKKLTYLQYSVGLDQPALLESNVLLHVTPATYRIMPFDNLFIRVMTPDPQWSAIFNMGSSGQGGAVTEESASLLGYPVDNDGNIEIPYVGRMKVGGSTLQEIKAALDSTFKTYLSDAAITIRLVNNFVSIIGEVNSPGRYPLTKDRVNIFEALATAGDLNAYSDRRKIQLIRPSSYGPIIREFSLTDRSILTSEYFYILPNDIIYAQPIKGRNFQMNSSVYSTIMGSLTSILSLVTTFFVIIGYNR